MRDVERRIARIAGRQDNVIGLEQLLEAGLGHDAVAYRVKAGTMQRLHRGVFLLGAAPPTPVARARAAVMACGEGAVVSRRSAAESFALLPATDLEVDVTVVGRNPGVHSGVRLHRPRALARHEITSVRGIPVSSVARIIPDLAATEPQGEVEHAYQEALYRRIVTERQMVSVVKRAPRRRGANGLVVAFDGWQAHGHRGAFESNRKRDQVMLANGVRAMRVTDRQLVHEPVEPAARIAMSLSRVQAPDPPETAAVAGSGRPARGRSAVPER